MTAVSVVWNGERFAAAGTGTTTANIGGGAGAGVEPDIRYQGDDDNSRKVGTSPSGFWIVFSAKDASTATGQYTVGVLKYAAGNWAALETLATPGMESRFGSGTGLTRNMIYSARTITRKKADLSFLRWIPNISGYRTSTVGSPNFASCTHSGVVGDFTATSKSENLAQSAVDFGDGYTVTRRRRR